MKIAAQTRPTQMKGKARTTGGAASGAAFQSAFASGRPVAAGNITAMNSLAPVSALVAIQETPSVGDALTGKRRAVANAEEMLDLMDDIKLGLLGGAVSGRKLDALANLAAEKRADVEDDRLGDVLDHISLRAQVELAKLGKL